MVVDKWMVNCEKMFVFFLIEVDDEILSFVIFINLDMDERFYFNVFFIGFREF